MTESQHKGSWEGGDVLHHMSVTVVTLLYAFSKTRGSEHNQN